MKKKPIRLRRGKAAELAVICGVGKTTVWHALRWDADTETQNLVRQKAKELGFIKKF